MTKTFDTVKTTRSNFLKLIGDLSIESLNEIPAGFNNNLIWNFGHIIVSQQILCYQFANLKPIIDEGYILKYKNGTKPEAFIDNAEFEILKGYLTSTLDQLIVDFNKGEFKNYNPFTTRFGVPINNINEAIGYLPTHEGLHLGYSIAVKKLVKK